MRADTAPVPSGVLEDLPPEQLEQTKKALPLRPSS
jgi:hypothetical protein